MSERKSPEVWVWNGERINIKEFSQYHFNKVFDALEKYPRWFGYTSEEWKKSLTSEISRRRNELPSLNKHQYIKDVDARRLAKVDIVVNQIFNKLKIK